MEKLIFIEFMIYFPKIVPKLRILKKNHNFETKTKTLYKFNKRKLKYMAKTRCYDINNSKFKNDKRFKTCVDKYVQKISLSRRVSVEMLRIANKVILHFFGVLNDAE